MHGKTNDPEIAKQWRHIAVKSATHIAEASHLSDA